MKEQISWDPSLVKKFSSSNHFKLLNQLRTEVKKYPLNKKKHLSSPSKDKITETINKTNNISNQDISISQNSNFSNVRSNNLSSVSFNNSKNFSIYNNITSESIKDQNEKFQLFDKKDITHSTPSSFKDRLNKIDLK